MRSKLIGFIFLSLMIPFSWAGAFELRAPAKAGCYFDDFPESLGPSYRKLAVEKCKNFREKYKDIYSKYQKLSNLKPYTEEKLVEAFGEKWRLELRDLRRNIVQLEDLYGPRLERAGLSGPLVSTLNLPKEYTSELKISFLEEIDQAYNEVMNTSIRRKDFETVGTDATAIWFIFGERDKKINEQYLPRSNHLANWTRCNHPEASSWVVAINKKESCEQAKASNSKYVDLISKDKASKPAAKTAVPAAGTN